MTPIDWVAFGFAFFILGRWYESYNTPPPEIIYDKDKNQFLIPDHVKVRLGKINNG